MKTIKELENDFRNENQAIIYDWLKGNISDKYFIQLMYSRIALSLAVLK